jgi:hypothetical protein
MFGIYCGNCFVAEKELDSARIIGSQFIGFTS